MVSDQFVEEYLMAIDSVLKISGPSHWPGAAQVLRNAAEAAQDPARREHLLKAAEAVAAGEPCSRLTLEGLADRQAAVVSTAMAEQLAEPPTGEDEDEDEDQGDDQLHDAPPKLPHLPVRHFFRDLVICVAQDFTEANGGKLQQGTVLKLLRSDPNDDGSYALIPLAGPVRSVRLNPRQHAEIIENADNAWFQPLPSGECLSELCYWIAQELTKAEEATDEEEADDYEDRIDRIDTLLGDVSLCQDWLEDPKGEPPDPDSAPLAAEIFGRDHRATAWVHLLYAGIAVTSAE